MFKTKEKPPANQSLILVNQACRVKNCSNKHVIPTAMPGMKLVSVREDFRTSSGRVSKGKKLLDM